MRLGSLTGSIVISGRLPARPITRPIIAYGEKKKKSKQITRTGG